MKRALTLLCTLLMLVSLVACSSEEKKPKIGVSFGVGPAIRWVQEKGYMEERAKELGVELEARLNQTDTPKTQYEDCVEMIDSGIDVLIFIPRDATKASNVLEYAKSKNVPVINYARIVLGNEDIDLFVGYDSHRIGQKMGQYLVEVAFKGDYILLRGDPTDNNAKLLHEGAMRYINPMKGNIRIIHDAAITGWSPEEAKKQVLQAVKANNNHVDAILAPNDKLAAASREALDELGVTTPVAITGMDAELEAAKRIIAGTQSMTFYMDLKELSYTAVNEAVHIAKKEKVNINGQFDNGSNRLINANLITGQLVTKDNIDKLLVETGYFSKEELYGPENQ